MSGVKAVGLLFVPVFGIYWFFRVIPGLSSALTRSIEARAPNENASAGYGTSSNVPQGSVSAPKLRQNQFKYRATTSRDEPRGDRQHRHKWRCLLGPSSPFPTMPEILHRRL